MGHKRAGLQVGVTTRGVGLCGKGPPVPLTTSRTVSTSGLILAPTALQGTTTLSTAEKKAYAARLSKGVGQIVPQLAAATPDDDLSFSKIYDRYAKYGLLLAVEVNQCTVCVLHCDSKACITYACLNSSSLAL